MVEVLGPDHRRTFRIELRIGGRAVAMGEGHTIKLAQQEAARGALESLDELISIARAQEPAADYSSAEALAAEVNRPEAQAIFISCSNFRTIEIIESLEHRFGKPVVTSNASSLWKMLRIIGDRRAVPGAGRLFREA